ncbi:MAG: Ig-like domain-containing protein, partial [Gemmatimonadota bacterium]
MRRSAGRVRIFLLCLALAACGRDATAPPSASGILSRVPAAGATGVPITGSIQIEFRWPVTLPADTPAALWVERGGTRVPTRLSRPDARTVVLTPLDAFDAGSTHTVHLGPGITYGDGVVATTHWSFTTAGLPLPDLDGSRLLAHVTALAHDSMRGRRYGSPDELRAAGYIRTELVRYGLAALTDDVWFQPFTGVRFPGTSQNVVGVVRGTGSLRDEWVL